MMFFIALLHWFVPAFDVRETALPDTTPQAHKAWAVDVIRTSPANLAQQARHIDLRNIHH